MADEGTNVGNEMGDLGLQTSTTLIQTTAIPIMG